MADSGNGGSNTAIVALLVLALLAVGVAFFFWRSGYFKMGEQQNINIDVKLPEAPQPGPPPGTPQ